MSALTELLVYEALVTGIIAAFAYRTGLRNGRAQFKRAVEAEALAHRCGECGAVPRMQLIHVSGCESGWPRHAYIGVGE